LVSLDVVVKQEDSLIFWGVKDVFGQFLILSILTVIIWVLESVFGMPTLGCGAIWLRRFSTTCAWMPEHLQELSLPILKSAALAG